MYTTRWGNLHIKHFTWCLKKMGLQLLPTKQARTHARAHSRTHEHPAHRTSWSKPLFEAHPLGILGRWRQDPIFYSIPSSCSTISCTTSAQVSKGYRHYRGPVLPTMSRPWLLASPKFTAQTFQILWMMRRVSFGQKLWQEKASALLLLQCVWVTRGFNTVGFDKYTLWQQGNSVSGLTYWGRASSSQLVSAKVYVWV